MTWRFHIVEIGKDIKDDKDECREGETQDTREKKKEEEKIGRR